MGVVVQVGIDDRGAAALLKELGVKLNDRSVLMRTIGTVVRDSSKDNFRAGGRPEKWLPSFSAEDRKQKKGTGYTLLDTHRLMNSITYDNVTPESVEVGTNVEYAAVHQFGINKRVTVPEHTRRSRTGKRFRVKAFSRYMKLPARPFLLVQTEDWQRVAGVINDYLTRGFA